jgi:cell wall-associated NlpC family hydrolase
LAEGLQGGSTGAVHVGQPTRFGDRSTFGLTGVSQVFDTRIVAIRHDLADIAVAGTYFAPHYAAPMMRACTAAHTPIRRTNSADGEAVSELLYGEGFALLDVTGDWAWGYAAADHVVGYVLASTLGSPIAPSHRVGPSGAALRYAAAPDSALIIDLPAQAQLMGSGSGEWVQTAAGYVAAADLTPPDAVAADPVAFAENIDGAPLVPGGRTAAGIDDSGLVQLCAASVGVSLPRFVDLQADALAQDVAPDAPLTRGDIVFFPNHVAIMADSDSLWHASRHAAKVVHEPIADVIARITAKGFDTPVVARKRLR